MTKNPTGRPRKHVTEETIEAIADALAQIGFMPDRVRIARVLVPMLAGLTDREPAAVAAQFRNAYVARMRQQWKAFGRDFEEHVEVAKAWGDRYFSEIMGLKVANPNTSEVV